MCAATRRNLSKIKGFSEQKTEKVKEAASKCAVSSPNLSRREEHKGKTNEAERDKGEVERVLTTNQKKKSLHPTTL